MRRNQIKIGAVLSYSQTIVSIIVGLLYTPFMIQLLGKNEYGLYNTIASIISMLSILSLGFNSCYIRYYSKYNQDEDAESIYKLNGLFLIIFLIIGAVALFCGLFLTFHLELVFKTGLTVQEYGIAWKLMLLLTINLTISFPMSVFSNIISAHEEFIFLKAINILKTVLNPILAIPLLLLGSGSIGIVITTLLISIITDIFYLFFVKLKLKQKFYFHGFECGIMKSLFAYTFFVALHLIVDQINLNVDKVLLGRFQGTEEVAVYSVGASLYSYYLVIGLPIAGMFAPRVHDVVTKNERDLRVRLTEIFTKVGRTQWIILSLVMTGVLFFGKPFIKFWVGGGYQNSYYVGILLIVAGTTDLIQNIGIEIQRAQNKHQFRAVVYVIMAILNIFISIFLCQRFGAIGCAFGTALSLILVQGVCINIYYHKKCNIDILLFWKNILRMCIGLIIPCIVGCIMVKFIDFSSIWILLICIIGYTIVYCVSMWLFGINQEEKGVIKIPFQKLFRRKS